jgi:hypothetical protein
VNALPRLETIVCELLETFDIIAPPVAIESMLQHPRPDMWSEVNPRNISLGFLSSKEQYAPRMSLARLLAREIVSSDWGRQRHVPELVAEEGQMQAFARMLIMPVHMIQALSGGARTPAELSRHFEVPVEDARLRLAELTDYL